MRQEKLNKILKDKVDSIDELPAEFSFNSNATWQKLEQQIEGKNKKKPLFYYYAAAALIITIIATWLILPGTKNLDVASKAITKKPAIVTEPNTHIEATTESTIDIVEVKPDQFESPYKPLVTTKLFNKTQHQDKDKALQFQDSTKLPVRKEVLEETLVEVPVANNVTIKPLQKKKFKVIHINEDDQEFQYGNVVAKDQQKSKESFFKFKIGSQQNLESVNGNSPAIIKEQSLIKPLSIN